MKPIHLRRAIGLVLIALAILGTTSVMKKELPLALFGEHSTGIVKNVEKITTSTNSKWEYRNGRRYAVSRGGESTFMTITFATKDGKAMEVETLATFNTEAKVGDSHPMIYLPAKPETAKIYSAKQLWLPLGVGIAFSLVCGLGGLHLLRRQPSA